MKLKHDNDPLAEKEKYLTNVEVVLSKHPNQFRILSILLLWVSKCKARCICGFPIRREDLRYYPNHDGGMNIPFEDTKCWVYSHCPNCGIDYNWHKIVDQLDRYFTIHRVEGGFQIHRV